MVTISNLHQELEDRQAKINKIYESVFRKAVDRVKYINSQSTNCECLFTIPAFMFGVPLYNLNFCRQYVIARLEDHNFFVRVSPPNIIYISWKYRPINDNDSYTMRPLTYNAPTKYGGFLDTKRPLTLLDAAEASMPLDPDENKQNLFDKIDSEFINKNTMNTGLFPMGGSSNPKRTQIIQRRPMPTDLDAILNQLDGGLNNINGSLLP